VVKILSEAFTSPADAAVGAVVDLLGAVIVPQLADVAVVASSFCLAVAAVTSRLLWSLAHHAEHVLRTPPIQLMILNGIVTVPASVPSTAFKTLHLHIPLVMLAAENGLPICSLLVLFLLRSVRGSGVSGPQIVWVLGVDIGRGREGRGWLSFREDRVARGWCEGTFV
jgi:hypothetical protein